jgi:hypothetical protein
MGALLLGGKRLRAVGLVNMEQRVTVEYELTQAELREVTMAATSRWMLVPIGLLLGSAAYNSHDIFYFLPYLLITGSIFGVAFAKPGRELVGKPLSLSVIENGLRITSPTASGEYRWPGLLRWLETQRMLVIYPQKNLYVPIPKRVFTPEQLEVLRSLLQDKIGPARKWRK